MARKRLTMLVALALAASVGVAEAGASDEEALRAFLLQHLGSPYASMERESPTRFQAAWVDLNGDRRPEAVVYVHGRSWCGSGGCTLFVLERTGTGFRDRGRLTVSRTPIGVAAPHSGAWRDLTVFVAGGGIIPGYLAVVPFRGDRYAGNPTVPPARRAPKGVKPTVLIATSRHDEGELVYPAAAP